MKKVLSLLVTLAMLVSTSVIPVTVSAADSSSKWDGTTIDTEFSGGGTETDPYLITSAAELAGLASKTYNAISTTTDIATVTSNTKVYAAYTGKYFKLTNDIDLDNKEWLPIGRHGMRFDGIFDGGGHVIKNLKIGEKNYSGVGLFGATADNAVIKNLGVDKATLKHKSTNPDDYRDGADITWSKNIYNIQLNGTEEYADDRTIATGALIGMVSGGTVENCFAKDVSIGLTNAGAAQQMAGGLIGGACAVVNTRTETEPTTKATNCYVNGVDFDKSVGNIQRTSPFMGSASKGASTNDYIRQSKLEATNCYVANVTGDGVTDVFCDNKSFTAIPAVNCFSSVASSSAVLNGVNVTAGADIAKITEKITALPDWTADNSVSPINGGYPVLAWQNTWSDVWDGVTTDTVWTGTGLESDPYLITSAAELAGLAKTISEAVSTTAGVGKSTIGTDSTPIYLMYTGAYFKLTKDIDLKNKEWIPIGRAGLRFDGIFDGDGHVIKNLYMRTEYSGEGLFGATGTSARILNLGVDTVDIYTHIGSAKDAELLDETNKSDATVVSTSFSRCYGSAALVGQAMTGGTSSKPMIDGCFAKNVKIAPSANQMNNKGNGGLIGSVTGKNEKVYVSNSYVKDVELKGHANVAPFIGSATGILDNNTIVLNNCYAGGNIDLKWLRSQFPNGTSDLTVTYTDENKKEHKDEKTPLYNFVGAAVSQQELTNCYTAATSYNLQEYSVTYAAKEQIVTRIASKNGWVLDNASSPINGGYPVLEWERTWTVATAPTSFIAVTGFDIEDGTVKTADVVKCGDVSGTLVVALYHGDVYKDCVTVSVPEDGGTVNVNLNGMVNGDTIRAFVWDSVEGMSRRSVAYSEEYTTAQE